MNLTPANKKFLKTERKYFSGGANCGAVRGNVFQPGFDMREHTQMKDICTDPKLGWSLFLGWKRVIPVPENPTRKDRAVAEEGHKVVITEA